MNLLGTLRNLLEGRRSQSRRMALCETLSLGEKRFLAVVRIGQQQFLVGGAANSVGLLTELPDVETDNLMSNAERGLQR